MKTTLIRIIILFTIFSSPHIFAKNDASNMAMFNPNMPIKDLCSNQGRAQFIDNFFLKLSLQNTIKVSIKALANGICKMSSADQLNEIVPSKKYNKKVLDNYVFNLQQKNGCKFEIIVSKNDREISVISSESSMCDKNKVAQTKAKDDKHKLGKNVCSTFGSNRWCGVITRNIGESVKVELTEVTCSGMLCMGLGKSECTGNKFLNVGSIETIIVKKGCLD